MNMNYFISWHYNNRKHCRSTHTFLFIMFCLCVCLQALPVVTLPPVQKHRGPSLVMPVTSQPIRFTVQRSGDVQTALSPAHKASVVLWVCFCLSFWYFIHQILQPKTSFLFSLVPRNSIRFAVLRVSILLCFDWRGVFDLL